MNFHRSRSCQLVSGRGVRGIPASFESSRQTRTGARVEVPSIRGSHVFHQGSEATSCLADLPTMIVCLGFSLPIATPPLEPHIGVAPARRCPHHCRNTAAHAGLIGPAQSGVIRTTTAWGRDRSASMTAPPMNWGDTRDHAPATGPGHFPLVSRPKRADGVKRVPLVALAFRGHTPPSPFAPFGCLDQRVARHGAGTCRPTVGKSVNSPRERSHASESFNARQRRTKSDFPQPLATVGDANVARRPAAKTSPAPVSSRISFLGHCRDVQASKITGPSQRFRNFRCRASFSATCNPWPTMTVQSS